VTGRAAGSAGSAVDIALERWEAVRFTRALRAVDADRIRAEFAASAGRPMHGALFSVKDLFAVRGVESCAGSLLLRGNVPAVDAAAVGRLRSAGATVFGKGVCAEFGFGTDTENRLDGTVLHPDDRGVSPGGSSGGDAVAVGAGVVDMAIAGDYGGSVRWPAQATGVLGLRTGVGVVSRAGRIPELDGLQQRLETVGIMARSTGVLRAALRSISTVPPRPTRRTGRLLVCSGEEVAPVLPEVSACLRTAASAAEAAGYAIESADGLLLDAADVYARLRMASDRHVGVRRVAAGREGLLCASTAAVLSSAARHGTDASEARDLRARAIAIARRVRLALRDADALLLPLAASPAIGFGDAVEIAGARRDSVDLMAHCRAISLTGLPALSVPFGRSAEGRTISVQIVGPPGADDAICQVAERLLSRRHADA
jgi:amidase